MSYRKINIFILLGLAAVLLAACSSLPGRSQPGRGVTVRMARASWDTGWFQAQIFKELLQELGYEFREVETLDAVEFYFFAAGGDVDFWANGWFPLHQTYLNYERVAGKIKPVGFQVEQGALQGYLIDKAGFKGRSWGGLTVSKEHANWFIRTGDAVFEDFENGVSGIRKEVLALFDIELELEIKVYYA